MMNPFTRKVRGFRVIDLSLLALLVTVIVGVYLAKTLAGRERSEIARIERKIDGEKARIRLLQAEVAHLERPGRIERLAATYLGMKTVSATSEASIGQLPVLARSGPPPKPQAPSAVAALVNGEGYTPGVPPPPPSEAQPLLMAEAVKP